MLYFIFVFGMIDVMIYPFVLLVASLVMRVFLNKPVEQDLYVDVAEGKSTLLYYLVALIGIGIGSIIARGLYNFPFTPQQIALSVIDLMLFGTLMAIAEEQFFRGELLEWLKHRVPRPVAIFLSGAIFTIYHFKVYAGSTDSLYLVFAAGIALSWVTVMSRRLAPATLAHITNNIMAVF